MVKYNEKSKSGTVEKKHFCRITRMNTVFRKQAKVDVAVLRDSYINPGEASEFALYADDGALANHGFSYEFVSESLLRHEHCVVSNHRLDEEGVAYKCLVIPPLEAVSVLFLDTIRSLAADGLPVIWAGEKPESPKFYSEADSDRKYAQWNDLLETVWNLDLIYHVDDVKDVPDALEEIGILPDVILNGVEDVITLTRTEGDTSWYGIYRYNRIVHQPDNPNPDEASVSAIYKKGTTKGSYERPGALSRKVIPLRVKGEGKVSLLDPYSGKERLLPFYPDETGYMAGCLPIEEDEFLILQVCPEETEYTVRFDMLTLYPFAPDNESAKSFLRSHFSEVPAKEMKLSELKPWKDLDPELEHFAGKGIYHGTVTVSVREDDCRYVLELGDAGDTFTVQLNGKDCDFPDQVMKRVDVTDLLAEGENEITVTVTSNLYNALFYPGITTFGIPLAYVPRKYGIWETEGKKIRLKKER